MTAPRAREQAGPPSPPDRRGGGSSPSPYTYASAAGRPAGPARSFAAAALLALTGALSVPQSADAQTVAALVSNTGETVGSQVTSIAAQPFTTGSAAVLASVDIRLGPIAGVGPPRVRILQDDSGSPGAELVTLVNPSSIVNAAVNNFTAPANTTLLADTTYYVELSRRQTTSLGVVTYEPGRGYRVTGSDEQTGLTNWNIGDSRYYKETSGATSWSTSSNVMMFAIKGTTGEGVPLVTGTAVTSSPAANGNYETGEVIEVTVTFSEAVTVDTASGTPRLALNIGSNTRHAIYSASDSTATALVFAYPVTANDQDNHGISIDANALALNGGAIHKEGETSTNAVLNQGALSTQSGHRVNQADAFIVSGGVSVISTPRAATNTYGAGEVIEIEVEFSAAVDATAGTDFVISVSGRRRAALLRGNGTDTLVFGYTVQTGDEDDNGIWIGDQDRTLVGNRGGDAQTGLITSVATDDAADLTHAEVGTLSGHKVDGSLTPPASTDATLSALSLGTGVTVSQSGNAYTALVANSVDEVTVTPATNHTGANFVYLDASDSTLADADSSEDGHQVALAVGDTVFKVKVTAEDGTSTQTYTVTVTRAAGDTAPVWSATMTAGDTQVGHGYDATDTPAVGTLDDDDFNYGPTPETTLFYTVRAIDVASNVVRLVVAPGGLAADETLTLEFGGHAFAFSDRVAVISVGQSVYWTVPAALDDLDTEFPVGSTATVCLRTATQVCPPGRIDLPAALPTLSIAAENSTAVEGLNVAFPLELSAAAAADVTVTCTASFGTDDTAVAADLSTTTGTATIVAGSTSATCWINTAQDTTDEENETFTVTLTGVSSNAQLAADPTAKGTINDDDDPPTLSVADVSAEEGTALSFTVALSAASGKTVTVDWAASAETGDTATAGTDFTAVAATTLTFDAGQEAKMISVQTTEDSANEEDETFTVTLSNPTNATIPDATAKGTIENDDGGMMPVTPPAQSLVSNIGQGNTDSHTGASARSQRFTIGSSATASRYTLTGVDVVSAGTRDFTAQVCGVDSNDHPTSTCTDLMPPGTFAAGTMSFTAPENATLDKGETYAVVLTPVGSFIDYGRTTSEAEDLGKQPGWTIANEFEYLSSLSNTWVETPGLSVRIAIKGAVVEGFPAVTGTAVTSSPAASGNYETGEVIQVTVTFSNAVTVDTASGTPRLALTIGSNTRYADYSASDSTSTALVFAYPVVAADQDNDGISIDADALELNGGAIHKEGDASTDALLNQGALSTQSGHRVNQADASIVSNGVSVISTPQAATDTYSAGEVIEIQVEFNTAVNATTGTDFVLSVAGAKRAPLLRGNGTDTLVFGYTVQAADSDGNGIWIGPQDRTLVGNRNGTPQNGAITSVATGRAADLTHAQLGTLSGHKVDGSLTPTASTDATLSGGTVTAGSTTLVTFASGTATYTASVANGVEEVTFAPTKHAEATVRYLKGTDVLTDADGTDDGFQVALAVGANAITVEVTAEDGTTTQDYTVTVTRAAGASAPVWSTTMLVATTAGRNRFGYSHLNSASSIADDDFDYGSVTYTVSSLEVATGRVALTVDRNGLPTTDTLTLELGGHVFPFSERTSGSVRQWFWTTPTALKPPGTEFPVGATATACLRTATQTCPAGRIDLPMVSTDATLSALSVTGGGSELVTNFASDTYAYTASVASGVEEVTFAPTKHAEATVRYLKGTDVLTDADGTDDGFQVALAVGANAITVEVTAEDGTTTQDYTVTVTRAAGASTAVWSTTLTVGESTSVLTHLNIRY